MPILRAALSQFIQKQGKEDIKRFLNMAILDFSGERDSWLRKTAIRWQAL